MFLQGWVNGILINESPVYDTLCIVLLKILKMGLYFSEIDTRDWPYRRRDLLLPFNHSFAETSMQSVNTFGGVYSMILSTWNFKYDLALQSTKTISFLYLRHPVSLIMRFAFPKSIFIRQCR